MLHTTCYQSRDRIENHIEKQPLKIADKNMWYLAVFTYWVEYERNNMILDRHLLLSNISISEIYGVSDAWAADQIE